jgi:hypothetical protein
MQIETFPLTPRCAGLPACSNDPNRFRAFSHGAASAEMAVHLPHARGEGPAVNHKR